MNPVIWRWIIALLIAAGTLTGLIALNPRPQERDPLCGQYPYGVDYETCVSCIRAEPYCRDLWAGGRQPYRTPMPPPTPTPAPPGGLGGYRSLEDLCAHETYGIDYDTCVQCLDAPASCANLWRSSRPTSSPGLATPTPTPTPTPRPGSGQAPMATPTPEGTTEPTPTPSPTPTPTPAYDCDGGYGGSYDECISCAIVPPSYCESLFR